MDANPEPPDAAKESSALEFESSSQPLASTGLFLQRITLYVLLSGLLLLVALAIGVIGYHTLGELAWIDALLNASMILTGMGPIDPMRTTAAKLFASAYALFSGVVFISAMGITLSPLLHRILHRFHMDDDDLEQDP